eukprot:6215993-Amphidinium_carterae.2
MLTKVRKYGYTLEPSWKALVVEWQLLDLSRPTPGMAESSSSSSSSALYKNAVGAADALTAVALRLSPNMLLPSPVSDRLQVAIALQRHRDKHFFQKLPRKLLYSH